MQNNFYNKINVSTRILMIFLLSLSLFIANSIYLIMFMTVFLIILLVLLEKNVKYYINVLKKIKFWLLFVFIAYIIVFRDILGSFIFIYKVILIALIVAQFCLTINYQSLNDGIKTLFSLICKKNSRCEKITNEITDALYFIYFYMNSSNYIKKIYIHKKKITYMFSLKYYILPKIFISINSVEKLKNSLKLKYYNPKIEDKNLRSSLMLLLVFIFFMIVVFREVIL